MMQEIKTNIHIHTTFSDGSKNHIEIIKIAARSGIDAMIFTDHNIFVEGIERYYEFDGKRILVIMGQEIHNPNAKPQKNHLLALGAGKDLSRMCTNRPDLIRVIQENGGKAFIAHPYDPPLPEFNEPDISWTDWTVTNFDGLELWNGFSELKVRTKCKFTPYFYAFFPKFLPKAPPAETMKIWNDLHAQGNITAGIAGSDAHAIQYTAGPLTRTIFPYRYHFSTINNYVLLPNGLTGDFQTDKNHLLSALSKGQNFIANDLIKDAGGFRFCVTTDLNECIEMGAVDTHRIGMTGHVNLSSKADIILIKDGKCLNRFSWQKQAHFPIDSPGTYRLECYRHSRGKKRVWILSNPIYLL